MVEDAVLLVNNILVGAERSRVYERRLTLGRLLVEAGANCVSLCLLGLPGRDQCERLQCILPIRGYRPGADIPKPVTT